MKKEFSIYERKNYPGTYRAIFTWKDDTSSKNIKKSFTSNSIKSAFETGKNWRKAKDCVAKINVSAEEV